MRPLRFTYQAALSFVQMTLRFPRFVAVAIQQRWGRLSLVNWKPNVSTRSQFLRWSLETWRDCRTNEDASPGLAISLGLIAMAFCLPTQAALFSYSGPFADKRVGSGRNSR